MIIINKIDLKSGKIRFNHFDIDQNLEYSKQTYELGQDLVYVEYPKDLAIDIGWLPDFNPNGRFIILIIKDNDWDNPILRKETRNITRLEKYFQSCIDIVSDLIESKIDPFTEASKYFDTAVKAEFEFDRMMFKHFFAKEHEYDKESGSLSYSVLLENGLEFTINILEIDNFVALKLRNDNTADTIFNIGFEGISKISLEINNERTFLKLFKQHNQSASVAKEFLKMIIKPYVSIEMLIKE